MSRCRSARARSVSRPVGGEPDDIGFREVKPSEDACEGQTDGGCRALADAWAASEVSRREDRAEVEVRSLVTSVSDVDIDAEIFGNVACG